MIKPEKGRPGYRKAHVRREAAKAGALLVAIAVQLILARTLSRNFQILFTFTGILTVLPFANVASPLLALGRFPAPEEARTQAVQAYESCGVMLYELIFTTKEDILPADFLLIRPGAVLVYLNAPETKKTALSVHLTQSLAMERLHARVNVFTDFQQFLGALSLLPADQACGEAEAKAAALFRSISF